MSDPDLFPMNNSPMPFNPNASGMESRTPQRPDYDPMQIYQMLMEVARSPARPQASGRRFSQNLGPEMQGDMYNDYTSLNPYTRGGYTSETMENRLMPQGINAQQAMPLTGDTILPGNDLTEKQKAMLALFQEQQGQENMSPWRSDPIDDAFQRYTDTMGNMARETRSELPYVKELVKRKRLQMLMQKMKQEQQRNKLMQNEQSVDSWW